MKTFHFDLRHLQPIAGLQVSVNIALVNLQEHSTGTQDQAVQSHAAMAILPEYSVRNFTHFAEIDDQLLPDDAVSWIHIVRPPVEGVHLQQVVSMLQYVPDNHLRQVYADQMAIHANSLVHIQSFYRPNAKARAKVHSATLHTLGVRKLPGNPDTALDALVASQTLGTSLKTAACLVAHNPDLQNIQPYTAGVVMTAHILPDPSVDPTQYNNVQVLSQAIEEEGVNWSPVIECRDKDGNPIKAQYDLDPNNGGFKKGQQLYTFGVVDGVSNVLAPPISGAMQTASNDQRLRNKTWVATPGTASLNDHSETVPQAHVSKEQDPKFKWTVSEKTRHHGIQVDSSSIKIDEKDIFSIDGSNTYLRTLYVGYRLLDANGKPTTETKLLYSISASNTILGIPVPTDPTALQFALENAPGVELQFGSLGTTDWQEDVSWRGALLTGLWQYGVPIVFIIAGKAITSTSLFNKIVNDKDLTAAAIGIGFGIVGGGTATAAALFNTKKVLFALGNSVLSFALQKGMEALGKWITAQVAAGALSKAFGPVGWLFTAAAVVMNVEQMAVTTGEVLSSPANITVKVGRAIDVTLTLHPDPKHGEVGNPETAVWPSVGTKYLVTLQYKNGTDMTLTGPMPSTTSNTPLPLTYIDVPAGGEFRIIAGVYSDSGWLAGSWQSDWTQAMPNSGTVLDLGNKNITENLVPLAPDTQYIYKEQIAFTDDTYVWEKGTIPSTPLTALNCNDAGTLCELVDITINNSAFQVGYAWRASGQHLKPDKASAKPSDKQLYAVQNLSVLANPSSRLINTDIGFTNRPEIAYAPSENAVSQVDQTNFVLDPRENMMQLRHVTLQTVDGTTNFGFGNPDLKSWGQFPLQNIDALAVHPSNTVIACSFRDQKMMLLPLPETAVEDKKAPVALMVSGEGLRQGLMRGPKALAVAPDGRVLVLESQNRRVQAFDLKGNAAPSFTPMSPLFELTTSEASNDLDNGKVPQALVNGIIEAGLNYQFGLSSDFIPELDGGKFQPDKDPLIKALSQNGIILSYDKDAMNDPKLSAQIVVHTKGQRWVITDPRGQSWAVVNEEGALSVYEIPTTVEIAVQTPGQQWLIIDQRTDNSWKLIPSTANPGKSLVYYATSYFTLNAPTKGTPTYLDMAVEAQGHVYILSYVNDGSKTTDYLLDVYAPDGSFLFRTPDPSVTRTPENVVAGRITVDIWRNMYGLTFEALIGPNGAVQPGVAHWNPTPPLFSLPLTAQKDFNDRNIQVVVQLFEEKGIKLTKDAFIQVINIEGAWSVKDGMTIYHVYRSGSSLQVFAVPA